MKELNTKWCTNPIKRWMDHNGDINFNMDDVLMSMVMMNVEAQRLYFVSLEIIHLSILLCFASRPLHAQILQRFVRATNNMQVLYNTTWAEIAK